MRRREFRSDTMTRPSQAMRDSMRDAEVGDDVCGEDPTVNRLEELGAEILGKEAALFVPSGSMGNLASLLAQTERGDEIYLGNQDHIFKYEAASAALVGGIQPHIFPNRPDGTLDRVESDAGHIIAPIVVNAAGVHVPAIGKMVGLDIPVRPRQGQILVTERTFSITGRKMMEFGYLMAKFGQGGYRRRVTAEMAENGVAFVCEPTGAGNYLIGSSRRFTGFDPATDPAVVRAIAQRAVRFYPVLKQVRLIRSYAGLRPYTPDHFPIVSPTDVPGFFIAGGHEGNGITLSLVTGRLMAEMIAGTPTVIDSRPLHIDRFNKGKQDGQGQNLQYSS